MGDGLLVRPGIGPMALSKASEKGLLPSYPQLDWLRFVLASTVVLAHAGALPWDQFGNFAVQIFFALSGWLIGSILLAGEAKSLPLFYFNRVTRIWIPYFAAMAVLYLVSLIREPITQQWLRYLFFDVTFTHNWFLTSAWGLTHMPLDGTGNHFWSLAVEEQFYLLAPLIVYSTRFGRKPLVWLAIFLVLIAIRQTDFASITAGVGAASLRKERGDWHLRQFAVVSLAFIGAVSFAADFFVYDYVVPFTAISIVLLAARPGSDRGNIGILLGGISYPMYLNHWMGAFAAHAIIRHFAPVLAGFYSLLAYLLAVAAGALAYFIIDSNVMRRRRRWYSPRLGIVAASAAYLLLICGLIFGVTVGLQVDSSTADAR